MIGIVTLTAGYVLSQFYRSFLAVLTPALKLDLGASDYILSTAAAIWFIAFAFAQFPVGICLDRFGPRRTASALLAFGAGGGALVFSLASEGWMIVLAMALIGIGCAPVLMATYVIFAKRYPSERFALLASLTVGIGSAGNVAGSAPLALMAEAIGWRASLVALALVSLAISAAIFAIVTDPEPDPIDEAGEVAPRSGLSGYRVLLSDRAIWPVLAISLVTYAPAAGLRGLWSGPYLSETYAGGAMVLGTVTLAMSLSMIVGNFLFGPLDTLFRSRKRVIIGGNCVTLCALLVLALMPSISLVTAACLLCIMGVASGATVVCMAHGRGFVPSRLTGRGVTLINFFSIGGVGFWQYLTGAAAATEAGTSYSAVFLVYAAAVAGGLAIYLFSRDVPPGKAVAG